MSKIGEAKKKIIYFFCRPCAEYHLKTHAHYRAQKRRAAKRKAEKATMEAANMRTHTSDPSALLKALAGKQGGKKDRIVKKPHHPRSTQG